MASRLWLATFLMDPTPKKKREKLKLFYYSQVFFLFNLLGLRTCVRRRDQKENGDCSSSEGSNCATHVFPPCGQKTAVFTAGNATFFLSYLHKKDQHQFQLNSSFHKISSFLCGNPKNDGRISWRRKSPSQDDDYPFGDDDEGGYQERGLLLLLLQDTLTARRVSYFLSFKDR